MDFREDKKNRILGINESELLIKEIQDELNKEAYKFPNVKTHDQGHFENGHNLHSNQYYFAKSYFQSSRNCDKLAKLLADKICELKYKECTLIGFRNYTGLLLNKTKELLQASDYPVEYAIIEQLGKANFTWQYIPDLKNLKKNLLVILPVTCSCSTFIRLRKYLQKIIIEFRKKENKRWRVKSDFINIFLIQDSSLKDHQDTIVVNSNIKLMDSNNYELQPDILNLYNNFNWQAIEPNKVIFKNSQIDSSTYTAHPLIKLYSNIFLAEECKLCFPESDSLLDEKNIFQTDNNFESPILLMELPKFSYQINTDNLLLTHRKYLESQDYNFTDLFHNDEKLKRSHLYGHYRINNSSFLNYIRGNSFYQQNRKRIQSFFSEILSEIQFLKKINKIVFITSSIKHNSFFLDEISKFKNDINEITILRFDPKNEFIDNFMSNYFDLIKNENDKSIIIFFEDVISGGNTFKLLSNYIKHYRYKNNKKENVHGFDYVFSLINRTSHNTRQEILKKLKSDKNEIPEKCFISFFDLNVPVNDATHLGNPLLEKVKNLKQLINESHIDDLKIRIGNELPERVGKKLHEEGEFKYINENLKYFPFENGEEEITIDTFTLYKSMQSNDKLDLLKLYAAHEINIFLSKNITKDSNNFINYIVEAIWNQLQNKEENFFSINANSDFRLLKNEESLVHDNIIKILSRHPFTYYNKIDNSVFRYCLKEMENITTSIIQNKGLSGFHKLRLFKFYTRRLVELDSSFLISSKIIRILKLLFETGVDDKNTINKLENTYLNKFESNVHNNNSELEKLIKTNLLYKYNQTTSFSSFLLYSYKESIFKNHYRSIKLEELINSDEFLPDIIKIDSITNEDFVKIFQDPYYLLTGMIKAENIYLLSELKEMHKDNFRNKFLNERLLIDENKGLNVEEKIAHIENLKILWLDPYNPESIVKYYFESWKSDPKILNARKFVKKSRFYKDDLIGYTNIKLAIANMLKCTSFLTDKSKEKDFIKDFDDILRSVVSIIQPGIEDKIEPGAEGSKLKYALCVKYRAKIAENSELDNIYVISSERSNNGAKLSKDGLIYNLMQGLYSSKEIGNKSKNKTSDNYNSDNICGEQSFLTVIRPDKQFVSFQDKYYVKKDNNVLLKNLEELYLEDCQNNYNDNGLSLLSNSNMTFFLRLSQLDGQKLDEGICELNGKAVLIISCQEEPNLINYRNFMSNEKVRLLLLIKEELLQYIQQITESETFWELIKNSEQVEKSEALKHGINRYFQAIKYKLKSNKMSDSKSIDSLEFLYNQLHRQFNELLNIDTNLGAKYYQIEEKIYNVVANDFTDLETEFELNIVKLFELTMETPGFARRTLSNEEYSVDWEINELKCSSRIFYYVFQEIFINILRHSLDVTTKRHFSIKYNKNKLVFENTFDPEINQFPKQEKMNGGKEFCRRILGNQIIWSDDIIGIDKNIYQVTLTFRNH